MKTIATPTASATELVADAIRRVTVAMEKAIDKGHRSSRIDANDVVEILLSIADELDPQK